MCTAWQVALCVLPVPGRWPYVYCLAGGPVCTACARQVAPAYVDMTLTTNSNGVSYFIQSTYTMGLLLFGGWQVWLLGLFKRVWVSGGKLQTLFTPLGQGQLGLGLGFGGR